MLESITYVVNGTAYMKVWIYRTYTTMYMQSFPLDQASRNRTSFFEIYVIDELIKNLKPYHDCMIMIN